MAVDKNLFMYDLAIVAIMRNEAAYVKEWIEYHWAAGVDHFYIYDNESPDNFKEVLQPYIDLGIVTYEFYPGKGRQVEAYIEAIQKYRFFCRYIAFIDADEFIYPQNTDKSIVEIVDKILNEQDTKHNSGLAINWMMYGSNNLEKADYSKGVLERFTKRAETMHEFVKTVANPRQIDYMLTPHYMIYFGELNDVYESLIIKEPRILVNHYSLRSREEYKKKIGFSAAYGHTTTHTKKTFTHKMNNDVFDDSILTYFAKRRKIRGEIHKEEIDDLKLFRTMMAAIEPILKMEISEDFFVGKMETFLTCRVLIAYLRDKGLFKPETAQNAETLILTAINLTLHKERSIAGLQMLLREFPEILSSKNPQIERILDSCIIQVDKLKKAVHSQINEATKSNIWEKWKRIHELSRLLKGFYNYIK